MCYNSIIFNRGVQCMKQNDLFLDNYLRKIKNDYADWMARVCKNDQYGDPAPRIKEFQEGVEMSFGTKYIKILSGGSAHSFVVNTDKDSKFKQGDILMAASWSSPARNKPRGNIFEPDYKVQWNGTI